MRFRCASSYWLCGGGSGFEFLVNRFPRYRRFWEYYLCYVVRGKAMEFEFEVSEVIGLLYRAADAIRRRRLAGRPRPVGEDLAHRYLRRRGCTIVARNYRTPSGIGRDRPGGVARRHRWCSWK